MDTIIGLIAFVSWIWAIVILFQRVNKTTTLEKFVLSVASLCLILFMFGSVVG